MSADRTIQLRLTPVRLVVVAIAVIALVWCLVLVVIQHLPPALDTKWPKPVKMENVNFLYCWNGTAVCMGGGGVLRFLNDEGQWIEKTVPGFGTEKNEYCYPVAVDADGPTAIFCDVKYTNKVEAIRSFITGTMVPGEELRFGPRIPLHDYVQDLSRGTGAGSGFRREIDLVCGQGTVRGSELYTPYVAESTEIIERITSAGTHQQERRSGPDVCGVFHSTDAGRSWQSTRVGAFRESYSATIRATRSHLHLLRTEYSRNLWFSTQMPDSSTWSEPKLLIDTVNAGRYLAESENDTLHLCWMDMRLKKGLGFFIYGDWDVGRANNQVFYRNHHDPDGKWGKERKLSGDLSHCESPSMSVEGQRIVVAWHNIETLYSSAAIYYATSKDNGLTWSRPTKIENSEKSAGAYPCPKALLHRGIIHMFYNGVYQHREFPD